MLKVELITDLKGAYYRVDLRIEIFILRPDVAPSTAEKMTSLQICRIKKIMRSSVQPRWCHIWSVEKYFNP